MNQHLLYGVSMNIGGRIKKRLGDLGWERKDLIDAVARMDEAAPLTAQALSNLITRDSKRSEWDIVLAKALGVSVLWLVYGLETEVPMKTVAQASQPYNALSKDEQHLIRAYRSAGPDAKSAAIMWARTVLPHERNLKKLSGK